MLQRIGQADDGQIQPVVSDRAQQLGGGALRDVDGGVGTGLAKVLKDRGCQAQRRVNGQAHLHLYGVDFTQASQPVLRPVNLLQDRTGLQDEGLSLGREKDAFGRALKQRNGIFFLKLREAFGQTGLRHIEGACGGAIATM